MSNNILWKSFNLCFSKFKCLPIIAFAPPLLPIQQQQEENPYNSIYNNPSSSPVTITTFDTEISTTTTVTAASFDDYDMHDDESIPDFTSAFTSHRFFFSTPGSSNSIFDQPRRFTAAPGGVEMSGAVAVQKFTTDPYADFKKSMQEMIEAHEPTAHHVKCRGEFLHELLLCYLTLNPKHTHKFIVDAFADIVVSLVSPPVRRRKTGHHRRRRRVTPSTRV